MIMHLLWTPTWNDAGTGCRDVGKSCWFGFVTANHSSELTHPFDKNTLAASRRRRIRTPIRLICHQAASIWSGKSPWHVIYGVDSKLRQELMVQLDNSAKLGLQNPRAHDGLSSHPLFAQRVSWSTDLPAITDRITFTMSPTRVSGNAVPSCSWENRRKPGPLCAMACA